MSSQYSYNVDGVQETSLDEVEIDEAGNLRFADSSVGESETDQAEAAGVDEDGNLRIHSASKLLDESRESAGEKSAPYDGVSAEERQSLQRRQSDKQHYSEGGMSEEETGMSSVKYQSPRSGRRRSFILAMDLSVRELSGDHQGRDRPEGGAHDPDEIELSVFQRPRPGHAVERGQPATTVCGMESGENEENCRRSPSRSSRKHRVLDTVCGFLSNVSRERLAVTGAIVVVVIGVLLTVTLLPASFVYVEYYELALAKSRISGRVNREDVYHPGCHLLTPDTELLRFQGTAHNVEQNLEVFTSDRLMIHLGISIQYFIKPEELGELFTEYAHNYMPVVESMIKSTVHNTAINFSLDDLRLNRSHVEQHLRRAVSLRLSGDCCPTCCPRRCSASVDCHSCRISGRDCSKGIHMEMKHFQMGAVDVPEEVSERFLRKTLLVIEAEKELFVQKYAVEKKKSEKMQKDILNKAAEIREAATAEAMKIRSIAEADYDKKVQMSYAAAMKKFYQRLNITQEDHKLSFMFIRTLEDISDNLYNLNFDKLTSFN